MNLELQGKVAIVTGGSRGIGRAVAATLAEEGAEVAIVSRDVGVAEGAAAAIAEDTGRSIKAYRADAGKDEDARDAVVEITAVAEGELQRERRLPP